jgi:hypothetical protein
MPKTKERQTIEELEKALAQRLGCTPTQLHERIEEYRQKREKSPRQRMRVSNLSPTTWSISD